MSTVRSAPTALQLPEVDLGMLYVLAIPISAALAGLDGLRLGGANYTGPLWLAFLAAGVLLIAAAKIHQPQRAIEFPYVPWLLWMGYVWLSLVWGGASGRNIQDALQISMPVVVGIAASLFVRTADQQTAILWSFWPALGLIICLTAAQVTGLFDSLGVTLQVRALSLTVVLIGCVTVVAAPARSFLPLLGWSACVLLTIATGSRMATGALLLVPLLNPLYRNAIAKLALAAFLAAVGVGVFYTETFQRRFFYGGHGTLTDLWQGKFLSFGRFEAWPKILAEAWREPYVGHGVGSVNDFVPRVWPGMNHAHNDYLRIGFELGLVGLAIFACVVTWQLFDLYFRLRRSTGVVQRGYAAAWLGLLLFLITACTDNPLVYNLWYMNPLFALLGAAYGADPRNSQSSNP